MRINLIALMGVSAALLFGCGGETSSGSPIFASNLPRLANGYHDEGWVLQTNITNSAEWVSFGKFNVNASGVLVDLNGSQLGSANYGPNRATTTYAKVTIEDRTTNSGPSDSVLLAGTVNTGLSVLRISDAEAIRNNFTAVTGSFVLATPTEVPANTNPLSGVWFRTVGNSASLSLPALPDGWEYQAWVKIDDKVLSMGKISTVAGADSTHTYSGGGTAPLFPGEDFIANAPTGLTFPLKSTTTPKSLIGQEIFVTVEPSPDDSTEPYSIKILTGIAPVGTVQNS